MTIQSPQDVFNWIKNRISSDVEEIWVLALNASCQLTKGKMIYRGTVDQCLSHPREIFRFAIATGASGFILVHNHPGGSPKPSSQDIETTQRLILISKLVEIPLLDHTIVTRKDFFSFKKEHPEMFT